MVLKYTWINGKHIEHVHFQAQNGHINKAQVPIICSCNNTSLQSIMVLIHNDDRPEVNINYYDQVTSYLLPYNLVAKKKSSSNSKNILLIDASPAPARDFNKTSISRTGLHLR